MTKQKETKALDTTTEEKIKEAARNVFTQKGYAATRTRDIAEEAGINLALLNYYFRSKEKLFQQIMVEKLQQLFGVIIPIVNNDALTLEKKMELLAENYINLLVKNPELPLFILSEIRTNPDSLKNKIHIQEFLENSSIIRQFSEKRPDVEPIHFIASLLGMTLFPFIAKPILFPNNTNFDALMEERKKLVAVWAKAMLEA
ncbi:TetR family transcriptional regulator [Pedobacter sp. UBA4863]|uniref:TetR/AcrR family transcriptional regulator n=1 Tax=Pedobacter sp. UBA4863 TaxID=1947060 RepID=UPI0025D1D901|nr:TetR family transcriptional regulator [Pedobacter sp. UBA4863]